MIPQDTVNRILDAAEIVDVVSDFVSLKRRGASYVACCPFHNEKTPSFYVTPSKGIFKCFGCGKSGTAVGFVMEHEQISYVEALKWLAAKYHIEVQEKEESAEDIALKQRRESLLAAMDFAQVFFVKNLWETDEGRTVGLAYFRSRGLEDKTIRDYGLGWAPTGRKALYEAARAAGYKEEFLVDTNLVNRYEDGRVADKFFDRVTFPIFSLSGRVIAFGARTLRSDHEIAKYLNSATTEIYVKEKSLYGISFAKNEMVRQKKCHLVEGYLDVLSMHQLGLVNTVASSGTSLTVEQVRLIRKFTENVTVIYDGDKAGIKAALRGIGLLLQDDLNVKVVLLPDGDDPDSFARKHTRAEVEAFISEHEQDFIAFKTDILLGDAGNDPLRRAELINDVADTIALIPDPVKRTVYVQTCAARFDMDADVLFGRIKKTREKSREEALKQEEQQRRREEAVRRGSEAGGGTAAGSLAPDIAGGPARPGAASSPTPPAPSALSPVASSGSSAAFPALEHPEVGSTEQDLLRFLLRYGLQPLAFDRDSEFYQEGEPCTVSGFIRDSLEGDGRTLLNTVYRKTYEAYFREEDQLDTVPPGSEEELQNRIQHHLMDSPDRDVARVTALLATPKYLLTVKDFRDSMTVLSTRLVQYVPRALVSYYLDCVESEMKTTRRALKGDGDNQELLQRIQELLNMKKALRIRLGRWVSRP